MRHLKLLILTLLLSVTRMAIAQTTFTSGNLNYSVNTDGTSVTVTGHVDGKNATGPLTIPETVTYGSTGYTVTAIGDKAFIYCHGFTGDLTIPNSVTKIGIGAFYECYGFNGSLTISNAVTTIEEFAFAICYGFTGNLTIPNSVTKIGNNAFYECRSFNGSLTISNAVTTIEEFAFAECYGFTGDLTIPNSVTKIENNAFYECRGFNGNLTLPKSLTTIKFHAFSECTGFADIVSHAKTPPTLESDVFYNWDKYNTTVYVPYGSETAYSGWGGFSNIINLRTTYIKDVMLISSNDATEIKNLKAQYQAQGWKLIDKDLNAGCGGNSDWIYLLYKSETSPGINLGYITDFYITDTKSPFPDDFVAPNGHTYHIVPYAGGNHFVNIKGDLNSHAGGADIHLYYTKEVFTDNRAVTNILFNSEQSGGVGVNGDNTMGYDLNKDAGGYFIYMHISTEEACQVPTTVIPVESDAILLESGKWYTIDGRKQPGEPTQGGLYIHDGKIILFKP